MKTKMNKKKSTFLVFSFALIMISLSLVSASEKCQLDATLINQDPAIANPGEYVDLIFQVSGLENNACEGARFSLELTYPFSLDGAENEKTLSGSTYTSSSHSATWNILYKLRVDKNALDGENELTVHYSPGSWIADAYLTKSFNISVQDSRTSFDTVIQEISGTDVSIAIANIGKYTANSVVVRIPEQDYFAVSSTDGQMVGNLESGDYTIVSFSLSPKLMSQPQKNNTSKEFQPSQTNAKNLTFDIYYTDNLGERRVAEMNLPLALSSASNSSTSFTERNFPGARKSSWSVGYTLGIIAGVLVITLIVLTKKFPKQTKEFIQKMKDNKGKKKNSSSNQIPEWVKNNKEKERR